ncbi:hypothetical protein [Cytophaga aurantiaca]|uniref:hypothetical protein n=1 Tax=Cytophaga aurantiaca TaxID=29530 RepID=UPI00037DC1F9|nr:hypothetical protein [Cytophaga aurantiaca]
MTPFVLAAGEQIQKASLAKAVQFGIEDYKVYITNIRLVILNGKNNFVFTRSLKDLVNVNNIVGSLFTDPDLRIFFNDGMLSLRLLNEGTHKVSKLEMNDWFNHIQGVIAVNGMQ